MTLYKGSKSFLQLSDYNIHILQNNMIKNND